MTQDELDALPEWPTDYSFEDVIIDGVPMRRPIAPPMRLLWTAPDEPRLIQDRAGRCWATGWDQGIQYKRRQRQYE